MSIDPANDAYREGIASVVRNRGQYVNPYPKDDSRHNDFEGGWSHQIKLTPHFVIEDFERQRRAAEEFEKKQQEQRRQDAIKAYKGRKG